MIVRPYYLDMLKTYRDVPLVKILAGIRRCGKSTILDMLKDDLFGNGIAADHVIHLRYTSEDLDDSMTAKQMYRDIKEKITDSERYYLLLDEVQEVDGWEKAVNSLLEDFNTDIYVTGSNSKLMSSEISTYLTGRYISIPVFTLSFAEYLEFKITILIDTNIIRMTDDNLKYIRENYHNQIFYYIRKSIEKYIDIVDETLFSREELLEILTWDISDKLKIRLLELSDEEISIIGKNYSPAVCLHILNNNFAKSDLPDLFSSFEQWDNFVREKIFDYAVRHMCQLAVLKFQQFDGLNTVLPIGTRKINAFRTLTTESLAVFMPFKVQEVQDKGGIYFGENAISHNLIMCNKANLLNQSAFLLGVPGSGKSFSAKELIAFLILNTADDVLVCDPENEFGALAAALGKETATVIHMAAGGKDRLNAMYMVDGYGENNPIVEKSQFIMSLVEQIDKAGVGPQQKSIIDRCTALVYQDAERTGKPATLCDLRNKLLEQPEEKAKEIALSLELFTTGSLDIFGHESTVDLDKRIVVFDIHGLGEQLKPTGLLVITDTILNRVTLNWKKGKRTHIFIDEFHVVFENEQSGIFFNSAWRQFRKRNGYPTAITQNVEYLLDSVQASTMLSNSEFVVMLNQAFSDRAKLSKLLNISDEQMSYVTNADAGCGLIKYGSALVPFINRFPKDTELYRLMTTRPGEGVFGNAQR